MTHRSIMCYQGGLTSRCTLMLDSLYNEIYLKEMALKLSGGGGGGGGRFSGLWAHCHCQFRKALGISSGRK